MYLERLQLTNFKNYADADISFSNNVNCFVGNNGVGKTNILDAIYYLSFCKSFFNPIDSQNIRHGEEFFSIHGDYMMEEPVRVSCTLKRGQNKQIKFNKKAVTAFADHIGRIPLVMVSPSDQSLILGGSDVRRKFVDGVIAQADHEYLNNLMQYQKAVEQRNRLLKQFHENKYFEEESIALWDEQMVRYGQPIYERRRRFLEDFVPYFNEYFGLIADGALADETANIIYQSQLHDAVPLEQQLVEARKRDALVQYSTVGVHKDDFEFFIGDYPVKRFGSQGQQKTFLLALKLAQFEYMGKLLDTKPLLLLDDIFDKLDLPRLTQLIRLVGSSRFGQVFITDTQQGRVEAIFKENPGIDHRIFHVEVGGIIETATL
ncbi:MAG: DNA replication/repair protein RecF [Bacteroidales bacterium]|nr:DNA replication/repair protein RecF [Bacteroidales bacterium]